MIHNSDSKKSLILTWKLLIRYFLITVDVSLTIDCSISECCREVSAQPKDDELSLVQPECASGKMDVYNTYEMIILMSVVSIQKNCSRTFLLKSLR